jgi:hypothetical protein
MECGQRGWLRSQPQRPFPSFEQESFCRLTRNHKGGAFRREEDRDWCVMASPDSSATRIYMTVQQRGVDARGGSGGFHSRSLRICHGGGAIWRQPGTHRSDFLNRPTSRAQFVYATCLTVQCIIHAQSTAKRGSRVRNWLKMQLGPGLVAGRRPPAGPG